MASIISRLMKDLNFSVKNNRMISHDRWNQYDITIEIVFCMNCNNVFFGYLRLNP